MNHVIRRTVGNVLAAISLVSTTIRALGLDQDGSTK